GCINPYMYNAGDVTTRDFYKELYEEVKSLQEQKKYVLEDEKYRLVWAMGVPPWHQMNIFDYIQSKGGVVIGEVTYMPSKPYDLIPVDTDDPIREDVTRKWEKTWEDLREAKKYKLTSDAMSVKALIEEVQPDGMMCHSTKSCRALTVGQLHQCETLNRNFNLPMLQLEGDMCDSRDFSEAQTFAAIDAFMESLEARKFG
ncbi:MAG: 2-hydroxyacyl-CoA dehydratase family protein, partial [Clostridia bacterium]|nr:2-hydroxyacyl-CoA dehydratase family protein [Clostridia bacterium]